MGLSRRKALSVAVAMIALSGCTQRSDGGQESTESDVPDDELGTGTEGEPRSRPLEYFDDDGHLVVPVDNDRVDTVELNRVEWVQPTGGSGVGENGPPSEDPYTLDESVLEGFTGRLRLHKGRWVTSGLETDDTLNWDHAPVYVEGDGVWATAVEHVDGSSPTVKLQATKGNGGGVRNIAIYGAGKGAGSAPILEAGPDPYDHVIENAIIRYGGSDAVHLHASASGTRIRNCWLESCSGWGLRIESGTRVKVSDVHLSGTTGGILHNGKCGNFSNITLREGTGGDGVRFTGPGNVLSNFIVRNSIRHGVYLPAGGNGSTVSTGYVVNADETAITAGGADSTISNVSARDWGAKKRWAPMVRILGDRTSATGLWGERTESDSSTVLARIEASNCYVDGIGGDPSVDWKVVVDTEATDAVIDSLYGVDYDGITDRGTRTLINRWGTNDGDPNRTGEWHGHADYAGAMNATIWDASTEPWTPYNAIPTGGGWVQGRVDP